MRSSAASVQKIEVIEELNNGVGPFRFVEVMVVQSAEVQIKHGELDVVAGRAYISNDIVGTMHEATLGRIMRKILASLANSLKKALRPYMLPSGAAFFITIGTPHI